MEQSIIIKNRRKELGITQAYLANKVGVARATIAMYESGSSEPDLQTLSSIANVLGMTLDEICGRKITQNGSSVRIPVLGSIPAGIPLQMIEDILDYEEISPEMLQGDKEYFGLKIKGDSMAPKYLDGDVIIVRKQDDCESGQECVVAVNGYDATFKKVIKRNKQIILQPLNALYEPYIYNEEQISSLPVRILGVAVEIRRTI